MMVRTFRASALCCPACQPDGSTRALLAPPAPLSHFFCVLMPRCICCPMCRLHRDRHEQGVNNGDGARGHRRLMSAGSEASSLAGSIFMMALAAVEALAAAWLRRCSLWACSACEMGVLATRLSRQVSWATWSRSHTHESARWHSASSRTMLRERRTVIVTSRCMIIWLVMFVVVWYRISISSPCRLTRQCVVLMGRLDLRVCGRGLASRPRRPR